MDHDLEHLIDLQEIDARIASLEREAARLPKEIEAIIGPKAEIYRCEFCKTLYKPDLNELPRSYTHRY